jgi:hypothetical protein
LALVALALAFLYNRQADLWQLWQILQHGHGFWITMAVVVQFGWLINLTLTYRAIYRLLGMDAPARRLLPVVATSFFANVAAPSGGVSGTALLLNDARRNALPTARVTLASVLFVLFDYFSFLCVLAVGLIVLLRRNNLSPIDLSAALLLLLTALGLAGVLVLGIKSARALEQLLVFLARGVNRLLWPLLRRPYLSEARAHEFAEDAAEGLQTLRTRWQDYAPPAGYALLGKLLMMAILGLMFRAFDTPVSPGTVWAGFSIGYLFTIVSPTPLGVGVVEGVLTLALNSLQVALDSATVITLAYRGLTFWWPFAYGFGALRWLQTRWNQEDAAQRSPP